MVKIFFQVEGFIENQRRQFQSNYEMRTNL